MDASPLFYLHKDPSYLMPAVCVICMYKSEANVNPGHALLHVSVLSLCACVTDSTRMAPSILGRLDPASQVIQIVQDWQTRMQVAED